MLGFQPTKQFQDCVSKLITHRLVRSIIFYTKEHLTYKVVPSCISKLTTHHRVQSITDYAKRQSSGVQSMMLDTNHWSTTVRCWTLERRQSLIISNYNVNAPHGSEDETNAARHHNHQYHQITMLDASYQAATTRCQALHSRQVSQCRQSMMPDAIQQAAAAQCKAFHLQDVRSVPVSKSSTHYVIQSMQ